jgi:rhamnose transport system permease protein
VHEGVVQTVILWHTGDLGYLTVYAGALRSQNRIQSGATVVQAGRGGALQVRGSEII